MTSEMPCKSKLIDVCNHQILAHSSVNGISSNRLLSPIIENSAEILSTPLPGDISLSTTSQKAPKLLLNDNSPPIDESTCILLQGFHQCTRNLHNTQKHISAVNRHLKELTLIVDRLSQDETIVDIVEPIATRLIQLRVKAEEVARLLNQPSIDSLAQQISPMLLRSSLSVHYNELFTPIQLSMNQKSTLIDHLKNEHRYVKYHMNEYAAKLNDRQELLLKLSDRFQQCFDEQPRPVRPSNHQLSVEQHDRQRQELTELFNEYEQLQDDHHLLTLKAQENIEKYSSLLQSADQ